MVAEYGEHGKRGEGKHTQLEREIGGSTGGLRIRPKMTEEEVREAKAAARAYMREYQI